MLIDGGYWIIKADHNTGPELVNLLFLKYTSQSVAGLRLTVLIIRSRYLTAAQIILIRAMKFKRGVGA